MNVAELMQQAQKKIDVKRDPVFVFFCSCGEVKERKIFFSSVTEPSFLHIKGILN